MHSRTLALITSVLFFLFFLLSGCINPEQREFKYKWESEGILFQSDFKEPRVLLREFALKSKIIVSTELSLEEPNQNPEIFNRSIIPFYAVASGNDRNAVQLLTFIEGGEIQECQTNFGSVKTQVFLTGKECSELIDKWKKELVIFFPLPELSINRSSIVLEESKITINARNIEEQALLSRSLAEQLFPNAQEILEKAGEKLEKLK